MDDNEQIEIVLGHFYVAFGQGTGRIRFTPAAVAEARTLCRPIAKEIYPQWDRVRADVLEVVAAMGRVATARVTSDARVEITEEDVRQAMRSVTELRRSGVCLLMRRILSDRGL
jgi:hypothetical protein